MCKPNAEQELAHAMLRRSQDYPKWLDFAHRLLRALRWPFGLPFGREHFVVHTDLHRFTLIFLV